MNATILVNHPFLIPYGTKVKLIQTDGKDKGKETIVFFAGYRTWGANTLTDKHDIFPTFKAVTKDGRMSNRNPENWCSCAVCPFDLKNCDLEILQWPENKLGYNLNPNKYNFLTSDLVAVCAIEMLAMAKLHGITGVKFSEHPDVDTPSVTFDDDFTNFHTEVETMTFDQENEEINIADATGEWRGSLDGAHADFFDAGHSIGNLYNAFTQIIKKL